MECFFCATQSDLKQCSFCDANISFCTRHGDLHRANTLQKCQPFKVETLDVVGRVLKASQDLKKGQLAIFDKAFTLGQCFQNDMI